MTARVLIVDDLAPNLKLMEARLTAEYFEVLTASSGIEALGVCADQLCDIVLLDIMMPGMDGFEVCRRLKADPSTSHLPVIMVTALDQPADRVRGLQAGADEFFLTKPIDEMALFARVRSLYRLKTTLDELRSRATTSASLGHPNLAIDKVDEGGARGKLLLVDDRDSSIERIDRSLSKLHEIDLERSPHEALFRAAEGEYDLFLISLGLRGYDGLRLASQIRSLERLRNIPILLLADLEDRDRVMRGLDLGVNDYLMRPIDQNELLARVGTQLKRKHYADALRDSLQASIEAALVDPLTGLNNRRYLDTHLPAMIENTVGRGRPVGVMILDIDYFKKINDTFGHDAGDEVLKVFAGRVRKVVRQVDLVCRLGGEEFVVVMPDTPPDVAAIVAERVRIAIEKERFPIDKGARLTPVTVSIGLTCSSEERDPDALLRRADTALYRSKHNGRNQVCSDAA